MKITAPLVIIAGALLAGCATTGPGPTALHLMVLLRQRRPQCRPLRSQLPCRF